jgi:hypothetical protein
MPCDCRWTCPTCGTLTDDERVKVSDAVEDLERRFRDLAAHHTALEARLENQPQREQQLREREALLAQREKNMSKALDGCSEKELLGLIGRRYGVEVKAKQLVRMIEMMRVMP